MYVRPSYIHRRDSDKTYASCWLARVAVGSLVFRCLKAYSNYTKQVVIYGAPSWTIIDPCTSLVDPRELSIIGSILDHQIDLRKSIIDYRIDSRGSRSDVQGSIIVHDGAPYHISRKLQQEESRQPDEVSPSKQRNLSSRGRSQGRLGVEDSRNGTDRSEQCCGTERTWNQTERTVLRRF